MKIDGDFGLKDDLLRAGEIAAAAEQYGYDGIWTAEAGHEPFFPLVLAAEHTQSIELGTCIAVAFARNPMTMAHVGHDLQSFSGGRAIIGLGSQIEAHITKRYSMPWSQPAARMREFILAMRSIWDAWRGGTRLDFRGDFYRHTLMTPNFSPLPHTFADPKVMLAGVGPRMTEVAGEVADGFLCHLFTTPSYVKSVTLPRVEAGLRLAGRVRAEFEVCARPFLVTGATEEAMEESSRRVRAEVAFCGSTPAYAGVLAHHGWEALQTDLHRLAREQRWEDMGDAVDDEVLSAIAIVAEPQELVATIAERYGGLVDRILVDLPIEGDPARWASVLEELRALEASSGR